MDRKRELVLITAAKQGDTDAFSELYHEHVQRIYRYIYYRVNSTAVAEDLTSDVFVQVLEDLARYQARDVPFLAWVYQIAHARVIDYYRKARFRENQDDIEGLEIGVEQDMDTTLMETYTADQINLALRRLNAEQQQVVILRFLEGHNLDTTAELLGKTVGAVKSLQFRAIQSLLQHLTEIGFENQ